jgi:hypothetical protein
LLLNRVIFWLLWLGFIGYAFWLAPPASPDTLNLIKDLSTGNWQGINPLTISLFNIMGILPAIYACVLFADGRGQKIPAFPFIIGSFAVGAFAILPYLALRQPNPKFSGKKDLLLKIIDTRFPAIVLSIATVLLLYYGLAGGSWADFIQQWKSSQFIHVMSLDFCLLCLLFPAVLGDDLARRRIDNPAVFWLITFTPLAGALGYLCLRPPLPESEADAGK